MGLDAIFFGTSGDNRFDAPGGEFGVLYVAQDMFGAFVETLGHKTGTRLIALADLQARGLAQINVARPLRLVDLTGSGLAQLAADNELASWPPEVAQRWSLAFHKHPDQPDGLLYRARHDPARLCAAIFNRAGVALTVTSLGGLADPGQLARLGLLLDEYKFGLK